jgi:seryl-tRNA synthetase
MIDRALLREFPQRFIEKVTKKEPSFPAQQLVDLEMEQVKLQQEIDRLRHEKNELADQAKSGITPEIRNASIEIGKQLKKKEADFNQKSEEFKALYLSCPNLPEDDLPVGNKEANKVVSVFGEKKQFSFEPKNHVTLGTVLGWLDFEAASAMTGAHFPLYKGEAVKLMYALTMFMLKHNIKNGYEPVLPPYLVNEKSLLVASNFPKFKDQVYAVPEDKLYLIPTAEVSLANLYRDQILSSEQLPINLTAWTSCFRREVGSYGATERGLIRVHQFEKVELFTLCKPESSAQEQERMLSCAETILQELGLHYRVSLLATQDSSFPSAKTYDIEVWMPGQGAYYEVSSVSNCTDFQARRGGIRYRETAASKPELVHTLNGSSLALSRLMVALMETYQNEDGTITIPEILKQEGIF